MIVFYRDSEIIVNSAAIQIGSRRYRFADIEYIWHEEASPTWRVRGRTLGRGVLNTVMILAGFAGAILLVGLIASAVTESRLASAVGELPLPRNTLILLAIVLLGLGLIAPIWEWMLHRVDDSYDKGNAIYEIWVRIDGSDLCLVRIADATRFRKIYRGIERAQEQQGGA
jgi:hypothetical protein